MSGFSTRSEVAIEREIDVEEPAGCCSEEQLVDNYDLNSCIHWINDNKLEKVCLQFPDSLLCDSIAISIWIEKQMGRKPYILGDTSYGSCCVDEVAAEHISADGVIHFGHSCLSPTIRLPVLYIFPKYPMNVVKCISSIREHCRTTSSTVLLIFDVGYSHYAKTVEAELSNCDIVVAEPIMNKIHKQFCSINCLRRSGSSEHSICKLGHGYCLDDNVTELVNIIFIGPEDSRLIYNYRISFKGSIYCYANDTDLKSITFGKAIQRRFYRMERLKDAKTVGIIVGTLGVNGYLEAIKRVGDLVRRKGKKCYIISVGKPTVAKLANFSEIEVYVLISCPEAVLDNEKDFYQPILSVVEAEFALNERRSWSEFSSSDFRDVLPGGKQFEELPEHDDSGEPDVSLVSNRIRYNATDLEDMKIGAGEDRTVQLRANMTVDNTNSNLSHRSWRGLDPMLGQIPVEKAVQGRSGIPQAYSEEESHSAS